MRFSCLFACIVQGYPEGHLLAQFFGSTGIIP